MCFYGLRAEPLSLVLRSFPFLARSSAALKDLSPSFWSNQADEIVAFASAQSPGAEFFFPIQRRLSIEFPFSLPDAFSLTSPKRLDIGLALHSLNWLFVPPIFPAHSCVVPFFEEDNVLFRPSVHFLPAALQCIF